MNNKFTSIGLATIITLSSVPSFSMNLDIPKEIVATTNLINIKDIKNINVLSNILYLGGDSPKVYEPNDTELKNLVKLEEDKIGKFYRILGNNEFLDVFKKDKEEEEEIARLFEENNVDLSSNDEILIFLENHSKEINNILNRAIKNSTLSIEEIEKDALEKEKTKEIVASTHYELGPSRGELPNSTQLYGIKEDYGVWMYKLSDSPIEIKTSTNIDNFSKLLKNQSIVLSKEETSDELYKYLNVIIVDKNNHPEYSKSFEIKESMINIPMVDVEEDSDINFTFIEGSKPGCSNLKESDLDLDGWFIGILNEKIKGKIYETTNIPNSIPLTQDEFMAAEDSELDSIDTLKKYALVYFKEDNKIQKYKYIELNKNNIKGLDQAKDILEISLEKGTKGNATQIVKPTGKLRYVFYDTEEDKNSANTPFINRVYPGSNEYIEASNISVKIGGFLRILSVDENEKTISYGDIKVEESVVEKPSAETIYGISIEKGSSLGDISINNNSTNHKELYYSIDEEIKKPQFGDSPIGEKLNGNIIKIPLFEQYEDLKEAKVLNIYSIKNGKIIGHTNFMINSDVIKMKNAETISSIQLIKGSNPGTTRITSGLDNNKKYVYDFSDEKIVNLEINSVISNASNLIPNREINTRNSKFINIYEVEEKNGSRLKTFASIELTEDNTMAPYAEKLISGKDFIGPIPGNAFGSTKFTRLLIDGGNKIVYNISETEVKNLEKNKKIEYIAKIQQNIDVADAEIKSGNYINLYLINGESKLQKFVSIKLTDDNIKGLEANKLDDENVKIIPGNTPGTIRLELDNFGQTDIKRWQYRLIKSIDEYIPSIGQRLVGGIDYKSSTEVLVGDYSHILITGNDSNNKVLYYSILEITTKKDFADVLDIKLIPGSKADTTKINEVNNSTSPLKYSITSNAVSRPGKGDNLPNNLIDYKLGEDISLLPNKYINLYSLDKNGKIEGFISKKIEEDAVTSSKITISSPNEFSEDSIVSGGTIISLNLENGNWNKELISNENLRNEFFDGFTADSEPEQWNKLILELKKQGSGAINIDVDNNILKVGLPSTRGFDITKNQTISLEVPSTAIENSRRNIKSDNNITINPTISATLSGDFVSGIVREDDIKKGGKKIIITLKDGIWILDNKELLNILNNQGAGLLDIESVTRTNNKTLTISLKENNKATVNNQVINIPITISKDLIQNGTEDINLDKAISIYPNILKIEGILGDNKSLEVLAPEYRVLNLSKNKLILEISSGNLKDKIDNSMISFNGLPRGLRHNIKKIDDNKLEISFSGNASSEIKENIKPALIVKGNAITEPNSMDSDPIEFSITRSSSIMDELKKVEVDILGKKLISKGTSGSIDLNDSKIEFAINASSFNTIKDDEWINATSDNNKNLDFKPGMIFVRSKDNPREYYQVSNLREPGFSERIILESVNYDEVNRVKINFNLKDIPTSYEYKIDDGNWIELTSSSIELNKPTNENKIRKISLRLKATKDSLASKSSSPIDFIILDGIEYDLSKSIIVSPETIKNSIEYSINSTDGKNGSWSSNISNIDFTKGNSLFIRQKGSNNNFRKLIDNIKYMDIPAVKPNYNIKDSTINHAEDNIEFKYSNDNNWSKIETNTRVEFKPGEIHYRTMGDKENLPSTITEETKIIIDNPENPPEIKAVDLGGDEKEIHYLSDSGWKKIDDNFQYKIGLTKSDWQAGNNWNGSNIRDDIAVSVRKIATKEKLPSIATTVNFKKDIVLDIRLDIPNRKILATSTNMEYNITTEDNRPISNWITAKNNSTDVTLYPGTFIWIREKNKPNSAIKLNDFALTKSESPDITAINFNIKDNIIENTKNSKLDYKIGNDPWKTINPNESLNESNGIAFKPGEFLIRTSATDTTLESDPVSIIKITTPASKPKVKFDDVENTIVSIDGTNITGNVTQYEFKKKNDIFWINASVLSNIKFDGNQEILIRKSATPITLASEATTLNFTKNMDLSNVLLNLGNEPYSLKGTNSNMEYRILFEEDDPSKKGWLTCSNIETILPDWIKVSIENVNTQKTFKSLTIRDKKDGQEENQIIIIKK